MSSTILGTGMHVAASAIAVGQFLGSQDRWFLQISIRCGCSYAVMDENAVHYSIKQIDDLLISPQFDDLVDDLVKFLV